MKHPPDPQIHASCVEIDGNAVLIRGPSGSGKSDLSLRLIDGGARLVADDRTNLAVDAGSLYASAPMTIAGKLEVRGIGIVSVPHVRRAKVVLMIELAAPEQVERLPEPRHWESLGVRVPLIALAPFEISTPAKIRIALQQAALGRLRAA
jgi:HPr kinase/phosphorylase